MKVALVHDWLNGMRGGEKILEVLCEIYPRARVFTLFYQPEKVSPVIRAMDVRASFLDRLPLSRTRYRSYLPLFPRAAESFDLSGCDLVISISHAAAKGCRPAPGAWHVCYCLTPMRYLWFLREEYFGSNPLKQAALSPFFASLKRWDVANSKRVNEFFAISKYVAGRIERVYNRPSSVIYPPVDAEYFHPGGEEGGYFLIVSALVPYKRIDLALGAFRRLGLPLKIVGAGPQEKKLQASAGPETEFLGWLDGASLRSCYQGCRALIFPGEEDFGIVPLEAMACGRPVIGLGAGGLLETVKPHREEDRTGASGVFFYDRSEESLAAAVKYFLDHEREFDPGAIRSRALAFDRGGFKKNVQEALERSFRNR
jgi:glycosyltransferase involved in cell wall biosynthesis